MPNTWNGTIADRLARLDVHDRRCDANSRHCTRGAVEEYTLQPADGNFTALPDTAPVTRKCCGFHRPQFLSNGRYVHLSTRKLPLRWKQPGDDRHRIAREQRKIA